MSMLSRYGHSMGDIQGAPGLRLLADEHKNP
jgi:hypothetical protein